MRHFVIYSVHVEAETSLKVKTTAPGAPEPALSLSKGLALCETWV